MKNTDLELFGRGNDRACPVDKLQSSPSLYRLARPFLKWAGGKTQLIRTIHHYLPTDLAHKKFIYIEPFVGSGAVLFWMLGHFEYLEKAVINDVNADLINCYKIIAAQADTLIDILDEWQSEFHALEDEKEQKQQYYYEKRIFYNRKNANKIIQAALFIFLNHTCFNGLYRVNRKGFYNVPVGDYKKPKICDKDNILAVSRALQRVEVLCGDFEKTLDYATESSFFYCDPPYKPLSETSNFTSYAREIFNDSEQIRLRNFCKNLDKKGSRWLLSNSDMDCGTSDNRFFHDIYDGFRIERVKTSRKISAKATRRGEITELMIKNYGDI